MKAEEDSEQLSAAESFEDRWAYPLNVLKLLFSIARVRLTASPAPPVLCTVLCSPTWLLHCDANMAARALHGQGLETSLAMLASVTGAMPWGWERGGGEGGGLQGAFGRNALPMALRCLRPSGYGTYERILSVL